MIRDTITVAQVLKNKVGKMKEIGLFYFMVHYRTRCRSCHQISITFLKGKIICSSIIFNKSQVTPSQVCSVSCALGFSLLGLLTRSAAKCEEGRMESITYEKVACLQEILNSIYKSK